jgi:hypothetical protein
MKLSLEHKLLGFPFWAMLAILCFAHCSPKPTVEPCPPTAFTQQLQLIIDDVDPSDGGFHHGPLMFHTAGGSRQNLLGGRIDVDTMITILRELQSIDLQDNQEGVCTIAWPQLDLKIYTWEYQAIDSAQTKLKRWDYAPQIKNGFATFSTVPLTYFELFRDESPREIRMLIGETNRLEGLIVDQDKFRFAYEDRLVVLDSVEREFDRLLGYSPFH